MATTAAVLDCRWAQREPEPAGIADPAGGERGSNQPEYPRTGSAGVYIRPGPAEACRERERSKLEEVNVLLFAADTGVSP